MTTNLLSTNNKPNETLELLEWSHIVKLVSDFSNMAHSKVELATPPQTKDYEAVLTSLDNLSALTNMAQTVFDNLVTHLNSVPFDISELNFIEGLSRHYIATVSELHIIARIITTYYNTEKLTKKISTTLKQSISNDTKNSLMKLIREIRMLISEQGELVYENHPEIKAIQTEILSKRSSILKKLSSMKNSDLYSNTLQFDEFDLIYDKFVVAVRSDSYTKKHGSVIGRSKSGQTLFIEPHNIKEDNSEYGLLLANREVILNKICMRLSDVCHNNHELITKQLQYLIDIDVLVAKACFSKEYSLVRPTLSTNFIIDLKDFFHPLINNPVYNDLLINSESSGMIISGPNTGGKTVVLKTIALTQLFLNYGLFIPAKSGTISITNNLFYFSNDQQDLSQNLSSFAAESKNYLEMINQIDSNGLIIIDEIFNSTSSEEASALAIGLINYIESNSNAKIVISTHHHILKSLMYQRKNYISAHVGYDLETDKPTYKLIQDGPGSSMAFTIFKKLSIEFPQANTIADHASKILDNKQISYEELLNELSQKQTMIDKELQNSKQLRIELKNQKDSVHGLLLLEKDKLFLEYKKKLNTVLDDAKSFYDKIKKNGISGQKSFYKQSSKVKESLEELDEAPTNSTDPKIKNRTPANNIIVDRKYYSTVTKSIVTVISINSRKKNAKVTKGKIQISCPFDSLYESNESTNKSQVIVTTDICREPNIEIDCRGMRLEEFKLVVSRVIDDLTLGDMPFVNIIHGHGDGVLKKYLRDYVDTLDDIKRESCDGNDGATKLLR